MAHTPEEDPMRERVTEFIHVLKRAPPFTATNTARGICTFLLSEVNLQHIKSLTSDRGVNSNDLYRDMRNNHQQFRDNVERLGAASLAMGMSSLRDEYGFFASANREKAISIANSSLTNIVPFLIEAHIDNELNKAALAQLRHLANNDRFKQIYIEMLSSEAVQFTIKEDSSRPFGRSNYRSNLLYVYEYFRTGSTPYLHGSVPNTGEAHQSFADIVKTWLKQIEAPTESATFSEVFNKVLEAQTHMQAPESVVKDWSKFTQHLMEIVLPTDIVYLPNMDMASGLPYLAETVLSSVAPELMQNQAIKSLILTSIPQQTLSFAQEIWVDWEKETTALGQAAQRSIEKDTVSDPFRGSVWRGADMPEASHMVQDHQFGVAISAAQISCKDVDVWNRRDGKLRPAEDTRYSTSVHESKQAGVRFWQEDLEKESAACFLAGTLVHTRDGSRPIERLQENDRVLTRADTGEWGVVSDEMVQIPCKDGVVTVYGINDEPAFFTPNHPFIDKFGLVRAIDPAAAHRENPWLEVGTLKVGHVLLRTTDGVTYEEVPIRKLNRAKVAVDYVYGVHLREGLRNYHANGYLVRMNYPEITIKSLADALRQIPAQEQLRMLGHLEELQPLLSRFGQGTVMSLLASELGKNDIELGSMKTKKSSGPKVPGLYFQSRSFSLSADSHSIEKLAQDYVLPAIDCLEGQVWINGDACPRARVLKRGFVWSRLLRTSLWEHGMCTFGADHGMVAGDGFIWLDSDPSPQQPGPNAVQFQAQTVLLREYNEQPKDDGSIAYVVAEAACAIKEVPVEPNELAVQTNDTQLEDFESEEDQALLRVEYAVVPTADFEQRQKAVQKIDGPTPSVPSDAAQEAVETFDIEYNFDTPYAAPTGRLPAKTLQVQKVRKTVANGVQQFDFTIPALDKLAERLNKATPDNLQSQSFYTTMVSITPEHESCVEITINAPERLALVADDNVDPATYGDTAKSYKELKYTQLGITEEELKIPSVPSKLVLTTNTLQGLIGGSWIEFDPEAVGDDGVWHTVRGSREKPLVPVSPPQPPSDETHGDGKPPVFLPVQPLTRSKQDLITGFAINTTELKRDTQNLLQLVMYYHMNEDDRKGILGVEHKPTVTSSASFGPDELHSEVADQLDPSISSWIKDKYAPSYIAQNIERLNPEQQKAFNIQVDVAWQRRLKYFREGSGKHCLSQCKEYNMLNTQLATLAFRRKYPRIMIYINDKTTVTTESTNEKLKGMIGGKKWAHLLFEALMTEGMVGQIARESQLSEITKINTLEMYCTMLNALWRQDTVDKELGTMTQQLCNAVRASLRNQYLFKSRCIDDPKQLEDGIRDYLRELFIMLLDEKAAEANGVTADFRKAMIDSMKVYYKWNDDYAQRSARQNAEALLVAMSSAIKSAAVYATSAAESRETFRSGVKGITRVYNWFRRWRVKGDYSGMGSPPPEPTFKPQRGTAFLCICFSLALTVVYISQSWKSWGQWNDKDKPLTGLEKTRLVAGALQAFGGLIFSSYKAIQLANGWDPRNITKVGDLTHSVSLSLEKDLVSRSMHIHPDIVLEETDFTKRARRNAVASRDLALGTRKVSSIQAALLPDSQKPKLWRDRIIGFKNSVKSKLKGWGQAIKARCKFNMTETVLRGFATAMSLTMLVLGCITAAQLWAEQELGERFMTVFNLVVQFANLIVEAAVLFFAVPVYVGLAIMFISTVVQLLFGYIFTPKPPKARIQTWWENNKLTSKGFFDSLPEAPTSVLQYSINQTKVIPGADTCLIITGSKRAQDPETGYKRLRSISVIYSSAQSATANFLFDTKKQALAEVISSSADPAPGETCIILPPSLQTVFKTESGAKKLVYPCGLGLTGTNINSQTYDLGFEVDPDAAADKSPLPSISLASGEQVIFKMRGVIAQPAPKNKDDTKEYTTDTPPWKKYELQIIERYADETDELTGDHVVGFEVEKA